MALIVGHHSILDSTSYTIFCYVRVYCIVFHYTAPGSIGLHKWRGASLLEAAEAGRSSSCNSMGASQSRSKTGLELGAPETIWVCHNFIYFKIIVWSKIILCNIIWCNLISMVT